MNWVDLYTEGDAHPRRFAGQAELLAHLKKVERLSDEAAEALISAGRVDPPLAPRGYLLKPLSPQS